MTEIIKERKFGKKLSDVFAEVFNKLKNILGGGKSKIVSDTSAQQISDTITSPGRNETPKIYLQKHNDALDKRDHEDNKALCILNTRTFNTLEKFGNPSMGQLITIGPNYSKGLPHTWRGCGELTWDELQRIVMLYYTKNPGGIPKYRTQQSRELYKGYPKKTKPTAKLDGRTE